MAYDITTLKNDLAAMSHGTTTNQMVNLDGLIDRAGRQLLLDCDPQETKRITQIAQVFAGVFDYAIPADLKGNKVIDIFPQVNRSFMDRYLQLYNQEFDIGKLNIIQNDFTINFNSAVKTIRIASPLLNAPVQVNDASTITGNGTWAASGNASNLAVDNVNYVVGAGSLMFDLATAGTQGILTNTGMSPAVNLENYEGQGTFFLWVYLPDASKFSSVRLRFGSSSTDYWESTATVTQANTAFANGWNQLSFSWASATAVGSPDSSAIDYLQVAYNYSGTSSTMSGVRLNGVSCSLGTIMGLEYYSKYLFRSASGTWQETVLDDTDLINLDVESYNLLTYQCMVQIAQQLQGADALQFDAEYFTSLYAENLARYKAQYRSEVQKPRTVYYNQPTAGYSRYLPRRNP